MSWPKRFLDITEFAFDEPTFVEFVDAAQEAAYFEVAEIWLLKQMLLLVLFERFAERTGQTLHADGATAANGKAPEGHAVEMVRLIESIRKLSDSDFRLRFLR